MQKAMNHISVVMASVELKHEHKATAVAWLVSQWFDKIKYTVDGKDVTIKTEDYDWEEAERIEMESADPE
jgi:hypothetical protein